MLFGCSCLLQFISEEVTSFSIDESNLQSLSLFLISQQSDLKKTMLRTNLKIINCIKFNSINDNRLREFHSSVCLLSDKDFERRIEILKSTSTLEDISIDKETGANMKESLLNLKNEISKNNVKDEIKEEIKEVTDYLNNGINNVSSFGEAFPNYVKDKVLVKEVVNDESVFEVVKEVSKVLEDCASKGYTKDNIQFIALIAQYAKNRFKEEELLEFCLAVAKNKSENNIILNDNDFPIFA